MTSKKIKLSVMVEQNESTPLWERIDEDVDNDEMFSSSTTQYKVKLLLAYVSMIFISWIYPPMNGILIFIVGSLYTIIAKNYENIMYNYETSNSMIWRYYATRFATVGAFAGLYYGSWFCLLPATCLEGYASFIESNKSSEIEIQV